MNPDRKLQIESRAAMVLRDALRELTDDSEAIEGTIDGELNLREIIAEVFNAILEDEILITGIDALQDSLAARKSRLETRCERRKRAILAAMESGEVRALTLPTATLSLRNVPPGLEVTDEKVIPEKYWKPQPPKLDRALLKEDLKSGSVVIGATLGNGGLGLTVRRA